MSPRTIFMAHPESQHPPTPSMLGIHSQALHIHRAYHSQSRVDLQTRLIGIFEFLGHFGSALKVGFVFDLGGTLQCLIAKRS